MSLIISAPVTIEGTWTPGAAFGGAAVGMTFSTQSGWYVKVGRLVVCFGQLVFTSRGSSTGNMTITGLPFTSSSTTAYTNGSSVVFNANSGGDSINIMSGYVDASATTATIVRTASGVGTATVVSQGDFNDNSNFSFTITYLAAS